MNTAHSSRARRTRARALAALGALLFALAVPQRGLAQTSGGGQAPPPSWICLNCEQEPTPEPRRLDAVFNTQQLPAALSAGYAYPVAVTMTNTGTETWAAGSLYKLGVVNTQGDFIWGLNRVVVPIDVPTGASVTFNFQIVAPASAGTYPFQWQMVKEGVQWFGAQSPSTAVVVGPYNPAPTVSLTTPAGGGSATSPASIVLGATAADPGGSIASVQFYANGVLLATDTSAPFAYLYGDAPPGTYQFTAVATDNGGAYTRSAAVAYTVLAGSGATVSAVRRYVYDAHQRLCKTIDPEAGATVFGHDAASNVIWIAEGQNLPSTTSCDQSAVPDSARIRRDYDALNRMWKQTTPDNVGSITKTFTADGLDETIAATNPGGATVTTTYRYNRRRLLEGETSANGSTVYSLGYAFNPNGHLHSLAYPDNQAVVYSPDALGRATEVRSATGTVYARDIAYHPSGAISAFTYGNGIVHSLVQNRRQLPARSTDQLGGTKILDDALYFDANGNVSDIIDGAQAGKTSRGMAYDALDRLSLVVSDQQWGVASYAYDALDNIRVQDLGARKFRYEYDAATNRLARIRSPEGAQMHSFGYDARGNTTQKNNQPYVFDFANRMSQATGLQSYRYDGLGRRVQATDADGKTTFWIYSQSGQVLYSSEARRSQNLAYVYLGNSQIATRATTWGSGKVTLRYQHTDMLGSPVAETSNTGALLKRTSFSPYGEPWQSPPVDGTGYTGHVMDAATGLTYMQQRYYDPISARFGSADPMPVRADDGANFTRFAYAALNPFRFKDPDGRDATPLNEKGRAAEAKVRKALVDAGIDFVEQARISVTLESGKTVDAIADFAYVEKGTLVLHEVKDGMGSKFSSNQKAVYNAISKGAVSFSNAKQAHALGFATGRLISSGAFRLSALEGGRAWRQAGRLFGSAAMRRALTIAASGPALGIELLTHMGEASAMGRLRMECPSSECGKPAHVDLD